MKYTIWFTFPSQGTWLWDCARYAAPHKCWTGLSPFTVFLSKKHTLAAPLVTHQDVTMHNNEVTLLDMSFSFFIRHYLKNPVTFCFHHLLICLNSEGTFSKTGLQRIPRSPAKRSHKRPTDSTHLIRVNQLWAVRLCLHHKSHRETPHPKFGAPTQEKSKHATATDQTAWPGR